MSSKRQTTMAKLQRERRVAERRQLKQEKKQAAAAAKKAGLEEQAPDEQALEAPPDEVSDTVSDE
jgi:hypothetical protein